LINVFSDYSKKDLYDYLSSFQLDRDIGSKFQYSNTGYCVLGHVLTCIDGTEYEPLVEKRICNPLGMERTGVTMTPAMRNNMASGHSEYGKAIDSWTIPEHLAGTGALRSCANDLLTFAGANLGLIKSNLLPAMELTHVARGKKDGNDGFIAMGWTLHNDNGEDYLWKDGATGGFRSFVGIDRKRKIGIVILSNSSNATTDMGLHFIDSHAALSPYTFKWQLLNQLRAELTENNVDKIIERYHEIKATGDPQYTFDPMQLYYLGNELMEASRINDAIKVYELNAMEYPMVPPVIESLAEAYRRSGKTTAAIESFEKLSQMDANNPRWAWLLQKMRSAK
jgi:serine-type D-Ala-D-Ala carboxypeptidase/endopeptidase